MPVTHHIQITATADVTVPAVPETAAVRLISLLPAPWTASLSGLTDTTATLALTVPGGADPADAVDVVAAALTQPELRGWVSAEI